MRKFFWILILMVLIPIKCSALQKIGIYDSTLKGPSSVREGESFSIEIGGTYSGLDQKQFGVQGIFVAGVEFEFDDSVLEITELYTDYYDSWVYYDDEEEKYYILSIVDDSTNNKCADKFLDCTPYSAKLAFFVKDTDARSTTIKLNELSLGVFTVNDRGEYDIDDMVEVTSDKVKTLKINIEQSSDDFEVPDSILSDEFPSVNSSTLKKAIANNENIIDDGSGEVNNRSESENNLFLKSLKIKNYKIDFKNNKSTYTITLDSNVNKLDVEAISYDSSTTIKIVGADDLKAYSDIVKVRVELSNHEKMTYIINVKREALSSFESKSIMNKLNTAAVGIGGGVLFILIIVGITCASDKRKLKKLLIDSNKNEMF